MEAGEFTPLKLLDHQKKAINVLSDFITRQSRNVLSRFSNLPVQISASQVQELEIRNIPSFVGGLSSLAIGVHVPFHGDLEGNVVLLFPEDGVRELEKSLLGARALDNRDLRDSAFSEIGNIMAGTILTVLSSVTEKILISSPPLLVRDMAGAILDALLADIYSDSDEAVVIEFNLADLKGDNLVRSVFIPGAAGIELLLEAAGRLDKSS